LYVCKVRWNGAHDSILERSRRCRAGFNGGWGGRHHEEQGIARGTLLLRLEQPFCLQIPSRTVELALLNWQITHERNNLHDVVCLWQNGLTAVMLAIAAGHAAVVVALVERATRLDVLAAVS
jgi:hypothetical protein